MNLHIRIWRLRNRHRGLEQQLRQALKRPVPDALAIQQLKRRKLQVKDELILAEARLAPGDLQLGWIGPRRRAIRNAG
jgi:hypothetical protein